jgi:branched-chain amino acid transport system substrate-binding protein
MKTNLKVRAVGIALAVTFPLIICVGPAAAEPAGIVRVAAILALSGKAEAYGRSALEGAQIAVDEINATGGVLNHRLGLVLFDNQSTPLHSRQAALAAVKRKVTGAIGAVWSTHSLAVASVLQKAGVPMISPGSTAPEVTRVGDFIFRSCYTDDFQGALMAEFAYRDLGFRRAAIMTNISETYCQTLARYFAAAFAHQGGKVVYQGDYKGSAVDFSRLLRHLTSLSPQVVFIPGYSQDSGLLIKQAVAMGIKTTFIGGDAWDVHIRDFAGPALEGSYFSTHWHPGVPYPRSDTFIELFKKRFGNERISPFAPLAYDAVRLLADAIRRAGCLDKRKIRDALAATHNFPGATGNFTFNNYGDPLKKGASILKFENGNWHFYKAFEPK